VEPRLTDAPEPLERLTTVPVAELTADVPLTELLWERRLTPEDAPEPRWKICRLVLDAP
jgi:hypothetical protein